MFEEPDKIDMGGGGVMMGLSQIMVAELEDETRHETLSQMKRKYIGHCPGQSRAVTSGSHSLQAAFILLCTFFITLRIPIFGEKCTFLYQ